MRNPAHLQGKVHQPPTLTAVVAQDASTTEGLLPGGIDRHAAGAYAALMGAQLLFATLPIIGKVGLRDIHFLIFAGVRMVGAALILGALLWILGRPKLPAPGDLARLGLYSVFGIIVNQVIFLWGLSLTTATNAALLLTTIPVFTYAIALVAGHEAWSWRRGLGIAVALSGVMLLLDPASFSLADDHLVGNLLILVNALSYALYLVISRPILERVEPLTATTWLFIFGSIVVAPLALVTQGTAPVIELTPMLWLLLGYAVLGPTVGTYVLNLVALSRVASSTVAVFIYIQPVATVLMAWGLLGETVRTIHLLAGALVLAGVGLVTLHRRASKAPASPPNDPTGSEDLS